RLLPDTVTDPWFASWKASQAEHLATIEGGFAPLPVLPAELASDEVVGIDRLRDFGAGLYRGADPAAVLHEGEPLRIDRHDGTYRLSIELPFAGRDDIELGRRDHELLVRVGPYRRALMLPDSLRRRTVGDARMVGDRLEGTFLAVEGTDGQGRRRFGGQGGGP